jgi:N-acetylglutamate synthase-like GNAT family acetyltransferase
MAQHSLEIRSAGEQDKTELESLIADCYSAVYPGWYDEEVLMEAMPQMLRVDPRLLASGHYFIASFDKQVAGCGGWSAGAPWRDASEGGAGHIRHFATHPDFMGKGVGGTILEHCVSEARAQGLARLQCFSSLPAESFYARHGFAKVDEVNVMLGGSVAFPAVLMERSLSA